MRKIFTEIKSEKANMFIIILFFMQNTFFPVNSMFIES